MIQLRQTAITDLNLRYARDMGDNKVRHYVIPRVQSAIMQYAGLEKTPRQMVLEYIRENEGIVEVEFIDTPVRTDGSASPFDISDVSKQVLKGESGLKRALKKSKAHQMVVEYNWYKNPWHAIQDYAMHKYFSVAYKCRLPIPHYEWKYNRGIHLPRFFTIGCEENTLPQAFEALKQDLKILHDNKLIVGHLIMPSILPLADVIGVGEKRYGVFCFPVINERRAATLLGKTEEELPSTYLDLFGVKYETKESQIKYLDDVDLVSKYQVEEIRIYFINSDEQRAEVIAAYHDALDQVNEVATQQVAAIKELNNLEKVSKTDTEVVNAKGKWGDVKKSTVYVNVDFKKPE